MNFHKKLKCLIRNVHTDYKKHIVKNVVVAVFANMGKRELGVKTVMEGQSAHMDDRNLHVKNAKELEFANMER